MNTINNPEIASTIKTHINNYDVISFDIFDTLLLRPYVRPEDLFYHLEKLNNEEDFAPKRIFADGIARSRNPQNEEITLEQIYEVLGERYEYLKQQELELEESVLTANPEMLDIFNYAKELGKKIIIVSDMYLPKEFIENVLQKNGYTGYDKLYLSNELNKRKSSGNLYKHVLEELKLTPDRILHIGDNQQTDCQIANSLGITAFYYEKIIIRYLKANPKSTNFYNDNVNNVGASIIVGISAIKSLSCGDNYWENLGYDYCGPLAYGYTQWLYNNFKEKGIKDILFVARDGYTLQKVFDLFKDEDMKSHYFYAPRLFYLAIKLSPESKLSSLPFEMLSATKFILEYYKDKHPFLNKNTPLIKSTEEGLDFIQKNIQIYKELAFEEIKKYVSYIETKKLQGKKIALVESLSSSFSAQNLVSSFLPDNIIYGYYWFYLKKSSYENPSFYCKAFQKGEKLMNCWDFMEFLLSAPEDPIIGISENKPVYKKDVSPYEKDRIEKYPLISNGALEFANDVKKYFGKKQIFIDYKNIIDLVYILEKTPTNEDIKYLSEIKHGVDSNHSQYHQMFECWYVKK